MNHKISQKKTIDSEDSTRFKIIFTLLRNDDPLTLTEISKQAELDKELVFHHLKKLKDDLLIAELEDKTYMAQPFFYEENIMEILNSQMKSIILTILRELQCSAEYNQEDLEKAIKNNLEMFIQTFSIQIMD